MRLPMHHHAQDCEETHLQQALDEGDDAFQTDVGFHGLVSQAEEHGRLVAP